MKLLALILALPCTLAAPHSLSSNGCVDMIIADAYEIGNQTRNIGLIAGSVEPNCIFTLLKLQASTNTLISTLNKAAGAINSSCPQVNLTTILPVAPILLDLNPTVERTMDIIANKKNVFDHSILGFISLSWLVHNDLELIIQEVGSFAAAIAGITPPEAKEIVTNVSQELLAPIEKTRDLYAQ